MECLSGPLRIFFSNNVDVKVTVDPLLDDFKSDRIVFLLFPSLSSYGGVSSKSIHYIIDIFFLEHYLGKVGSLRSILKVVELLSLALAIVVLISHFANLNDLEEGKNVILASVHTPDLIT